MPYRLAPNIECVLVKDQQGLIRYHYPNPAPGSPDCGPYIPWIEPEHAAQMLNEGLIEHAPDAQDVITDSSSVTLDERADADNADSSPVGPRDGVDSDRLQTCLEAIDQLGVPPDTGAPKVRDALRQAGQTFGNDTIAAAVRTRKRLAGQPA